MDNQQQHHHQNIMRNHKEDKLRTNQESDHHQICSSSSSSTPPSSNSSSPSHEFSFTISFQQTKQIPPPPSSSSSTTTTSSSSFAIDLSPADDIFFHGHLLPLTLLSHLPISSPRSSTNSLDSFKLPKKDHFFHQQQDHKKAQDFKNHQETSCHDAKGKPKPKNKSFSFSLFGIPKWRKGYEVKDQNKEKLSQQYSKKIKMSQVVKRYIRMVRPFLSFRNKKDNNNNMQFHRDNTYSFSGNLLSSRGLIKGQYSSAPASMRTSPTNSGLLVATPTGGEHYNNCTNQYYSSCSSSSDSTMEELQAAIQAAIAHCKKSISMDD